MPIGERRAQGARQGKLLPDEEGRAEKINIENHCVRVDCHRGCGFHSVLCEGDSSSSNRGEGPARGSRGSADLHSRARRPARAVRPGRQGCDDDRRRYRHCALCLQRAPEDAARQPRQDYDLLPEPRRDEERQAGARHRGHDQRKGLAAFDGRYCLADVSQRRAEGPGERFALRPDGVVGQRRCSRARGIYRRQYRRVHRDDERQGEGNRTAGDSLRQPRRIAGGRRVHHRGRHGRARAFAGAASSGGAHLYFGQGIHVRQNHATKLQPVAAPRPAGQRNQDRARRRSGLSPGRVGGVERHESSVGGAGRAKRRTPHDRVGEINRMGVSHLRQLPARLEEGGALDDTGA